MDKNSFDNKPENETVDQPTPQSSLSVESAHDVSKQQDQEFNDIAKVSAIDAEPSMQASANQNPSDNSTSNAPHGRSSVAADSTPAAAPLRPTNPAASHSLELEPQVTTTPTPPKKSKKKFIISGIIAGALLLFGGGAALAYNLWYQHPDKVLSDAFINAVKAKSVQFNGSFELKAANSRSMGFESLRVSLDGKAEGSNTEQNAKLEVKADGEEYTFSGSAIVNTDGSLFFKVNDIEELITRYAETQDGSYTDIPVQIRDIISTIDSKWVRITLDDLKELGAPSDTIDDYKKDQECLQSAFDKLRDDREMSNELAQRYKDNMFVVVKEKLGSENGSLGYRIEGDAEKFESFVKSLDDTSIVNEIAQCGEEYTLDTSDFRMPESSRDDSDTEVHLDVWVDRWSHQLSKATLQVKDDEAEGGFVFEPIFNEEVKIVTPKDFVKITDLKEDIEKAQRELDLDTGGFGGGSTMPARVSALDLMKKVEAYNAIEGSYPTLTQLQSTSISEVKLDADASAQVSGGSPSAADPERLQYVLISPSSGGFISYYDTSTREVKSIGFGNRSSNSSINT